MSDDISGTHNSDETEMNSEIFSVYILKSGPTVMTQAETYLRNRGCTVGSGSDLKEALAYVIQKQPQFILISADHPHKKVKVLPKLLGQAFPVRVIGFAEKSGTVSTRNLTDLGLEYVLYAPASGTSIQRLIRKIRNDDKTKAELAVANGTSSGSSSEALKNSAMTFKGDNSAKEALNQLLSSSDDNADPGYYVDKGQALKTGAAYDGGEGSSNKGPGYVPKSQDQQPGESFDAWAERMREEEKSARSGKSDSDSHQFNQGGTPVGKSHSASSENPSSHGKNPINGIANNNSQNSFDPSEDSDKSDWKGVESKGTPIMESEYQRKEKKQYTFESSRNTGFQKTESIIVRGVEEALDKSVDYTGKPAQAIEGATNIACITVKSPRFSGYLICALGKNRVIDKEMIQSIQKRLFEFLRTNGEHVSPEDTMNIQLQEVEFEGWALEQADFLKKSVHDGNEIAMAFFPSKDSQIKLEDSANSSMLKMTIDEFKSDTPIEFDLYIYMPENRKYLLYTPQGQSFYGNQKDRLIEKGVTHLHLKKDSVSQVKKYRAQNYLNDRIQSYKQAMKFKKSGSGQS